MSNSIPISTDVLIIGAGPVGLLLASELAREGVDALVIDQHTERSFFCKALGITARTLEIFEDLGIVDQAIDSGVWIRALAVFNNGTLAQQMEIPSEDLPYGILSLAQFETERLLERALHRHGGCVRYGWKLTALSQTTDGVVAMVENARGDKQEVHCRWLVGCDGAHSKVRRELGLSFDGGKYPQTFVLADLDVDWSLQRGPSYRLNYSDGNDTNTLVAIPVPGSIRRYRLSTAMPESAASTAVVPAAESDADATEPPTLEEITAIMKPMLPPDARLSSLRWSSKYRISHRIVPSYSSGRVFLAGDAAHIHPPIGGQGMNTGLQDAHNLAWKLSLAARGIAAPQLLESYNAERRPVGVDVVEQTSKALNEALAHKLKMPGMRETQLLIGYRESPIVQEERRQIDEEMPVAGDRAPDASGLRRMYVAHAQRLRERIGGGRHVLAGFVGQDGTGAATLADMFGILRDALGFGADGFIIAEPGYTFEDDERLPVLVDATGEFQSVFGAQPGMAWLVRPDGHIGWASAIPSISSLKNFLSKTLKLS